MKADKKDPHFQTILKFGFFKVNVKLSWVEDEYKEDNEAPVFA